ncbi:MAG TPA: hypothetical protein VGQ85_02515 [Candidatus Limnocylindrales bacterium]|nr:hypothetical protein [Candidatus Limnocylindrales bacterium]
MTQPSRIELAGIWLAAAVLMVGLFVGLLELVSAPTLPPATWGFTGFQVPIAIAFGGMGLLLLRRRPSHRVGWLLLAEGTVTAIQFAVDLGASGPTATPTPGQVVWVAWVSNWAWVVSIALLPPLFLLFPDGRALSARWSLAIPAVTLGAVAMILGLLSTPGPLLNFPTIVNPTGFGGTWSETAFDGGAVILLGAAATSVLSLVIRWRRSEGDAREQLKWLAFVGIPILIAASLSTALPIAQIAMIAFAVAAPFAIAIAILRHRLYDIDQLIGHTVVYGALTAILAGLYTAAVKFFNELFVQVTGASSESSIILATLVLAAAFTPVRKGLESIVERRYKPATGHTGDVSASGITAMSANALEALIRRAVRAELEEQRQATLAGVAVGD